MTNIGRWAAALAAAAVLVGCGKGEEKFRALLDPVVVKITERAKSAASLTGRAPTEVMQRSGAILTDLAGLGADLDNLRKEAEKSRTHLSAAAQALRQSADTAGAVLGRDNLIPAADLDAARKALEAVPLEKGA